MGSVTRTGPSQRPVTVFRLGDPGYTLIPRGGDDPGGRRPAAPRSRIVAGLLQLVPGGLIMFGGLGRLYAGHRQLGIAQVVTSALAWTMFWCGYLVAWPIALPALAAWLWFVIDGVELLRCPPAGPRT